MTGFLFFFLLLVWNVLFFMNNPLSLICGLLVLSVLSVFLISIEFSFLMGFCLFMCIVSGVLVLVAYCVALIPFSKKEQKIQKVELTLFKKVVGVIMGVASFLFFIFFLLSCVISLGGEGSFLFMRSVESFVCTEEWVVAMVLTSLYLFLSVVVCVNICSKYSGALIGENWYKESDSTQA
uniref:NADH dehydrogenase subunit 6 n=1 Tax=Xylophaga washingtona TaxID=1049057 RepID=UPI00202859EE|nr:NADH dehydrogenase subunit 6 [Xylophaga washingtona]UPX88943.1 NADH dehydrogenase subunit 6 [Xylophaga washingtona]UPX88955.1 NADH dehydrogenase subunit 6 [Xylophaga washingtona]